MKREPRVFLVNPANVTAGMSFITPRWLFVLASATPTDLVGDPILVDETIKRFDPKQVEPGDIVGIGITTDNCLAGYRVILQAKRRGAIVVMGGIHTTIFPEEPIAMGADVVVTGNADILWAQVIRDILDKKWLRRYNGGRAAGDKLLPARWDLLLKQNLRWRYLFPTVQTVAGCPENCTFCSVWVTEGRVPRQRTIDAVVQEMNELNEMGFVSVMFADDNFNPATLGRIIREESATKKKELERIREQRLAFFAQYADRVDRIIPAFTQMTSEVATDPEYLKAMHDQMGIRGALIGIESFNEAGLKSVRKDWNPVGRKMVDVIETVQANGIQVLSSVICGLETDNEETIATMREFAKASGTRFAQFPLYRPFPGTVDYLEMEKDRVVRMDKNPAVRKAPPKHKTQLVRESYWLDPSCPRVVIKHPTMDEQALLRNIEECWGSFYHPRAIIQRARKVPWSFWPKVILVFASLAFRALYAGRGISADGARKEDLGFLPRLLLVSIVQLMRIPSLRKRKPQPVPALSQAA